MFCAGRVTDIDLMRTMKACGGAIVVSFAYIFNLENLEILIQKNNKLEF